MPMIGALPGFTNAFIAAGHTCWCACASVRFEHFLIALLGNRGILNAPATGAAVAELIATGKCKLLDLSPFDPARFVDDDDDEEEGDD